MKRPFFCEINFKEKVKPLNFTKKIDVFFREINFTKKNSRWGKRCMVFFIFFILGWRTLVHSCWYNNLTWYTSCKYIKRKRGLVIFVLIFFRQKTLFFREITYLILLKDCQKIHNCNLHMEMNIEDNWKSCNNR